MPLRRRRSLSPLKRRKTFSLFTLLEREVFILRAHILFNQTFASIGALLDITDSRAHIIYNRALKKIKKQAIKLLEEKWKQNQKIKTLANDMNYIGGNGIINYSHPQNPSVLDVGWQKAG